MEEIRITNERISRTQDLFIDGKIDDSAYSESMERYRKSKQKIEGSREAGSRNNSTTISRKF